MTRIVTKYNLAMQPEQDIEMSVSGMIVGLTIEDNVLKILVDQEASPLRTRPRSFYIVRPEHEIPDAALRYLGNFALDGSIAFLYTQTEDAPPAPVPPSPLVVWSDVAPLQERIVVLEQQVATITAKLATQDAPTAPVESKATSN